MAHIEPARLADLTRVAIEAAASYDGESLIAATEPLWAEGGPLETLAFLTGCLRVIESTMPPHLRQELALNHVDGPGIVEDFTTATSIPRRERVLIMLGICVSANANLAAWDLWRAFLEDSNEDEVSEVVGIAVFRAGMVLRQQRARLS